MSDNGKLLTPQVVTVIFNPDDPTSRFKAIPSSSSTPIFASLNQGDMTCWLVNNGYQWITDTYPQQWVKE